MTTGVVTDGGTRVFRPRRARLVIYPCAALVLVALIGGAVFAPSQGSGGWSLGSRLALGAVALAAACHALAGLQVRKDFVIPHQPVIGRVVARRLPIDAQRLVGERGEGATPRLVRRQVWRSRRSAGHFHHGNIP